MLVLALIFELEVVRKILLHLGLHADVPPPAPSHTDEPLFDDDIPGPASARPPP